MPGGREPCRVGLALLRGVLLCSVLPGVVLSAGSGVAAQTMPLRETRPSWVTELDLPRDDTEIVGQAVKRQLEFIASLLEHPDEIDAADVDTLATPDFSCTPLRPAKLRVVFRDGALAVSRPADAVAFKHHGPDGMVRALHKLARPLRGASNLQATFTLFKVDLDRGTAKTSVSAQAYYEAG